MKKRFHLALGVLDVETTVVDYTQRLGVQPELVVQGEYALFRTETLNVSIRKVKEPEQGLRHLGWESDGFVGFTEETDCNGILWEAFSADTQREEIQSIWPE